jgi:hypothetical protein
MFTFNPVSITRGHNYKLYAKTSRLNIRHQVIVIVYYERLEQSNGK